MSELPPGPSDAAVAQATGRDWAGWRAHLDALGAAELPHAAIVRALEPVIASGWWRQSVTVGYERMIGRRETGQRCAGDFAASASRSVAGDMDAALARWQALVAGRAEFAGVPVAGEPRISSSDKWRYWRIDLADGGRVTVTFNDKPGGKAAVAVEQAKLADAAEGAAAKAFWKELLGLL